ncbi:MAG TPA: excinuclease ABC subunit UvrC [Gammaproteobacteria bacterium]|nr:excinuclease ABC subunit UvrC [Gammaproteobacteria bacterium]
MNKAGTVFDSRGFLKTLAVRPGVYRMLDAGGNVLYVGKAGNLRKRVASYFRKSGLSARTAALVEQIAAIEVTVTHTEGEALLLESNLIKQLQPRYNVLLRDDKSYPYIYLSDTQEYPRLALHRGARRASGRYFGPYPNAGSVRESLHLLQKLFRVRQCEDSFFSNRSRPCLQYQIKRCTAPCVDLVSAQDYACDVENTVMFLEGKSGQVIDGMVKRMEEAATLQDYEQAAIYRDQIISLRHVQEKQYISTEHGDLDIIACVTEKGSACVQVFFVRGGRNLGNAVFYPKVPMEQGPDEVLSAFIPQYYLGKDIPPELLLSHELQDGEVIGQALSLHAAHGVELRSRVRGNRARWVKMARENAGHALHAQLNTRKGFAVRLQALADALQLPEVPERIECFDISHTAGESTVASCVVFGLEGPLKSDYRRFNIRDIEPGDDYAAMDQAISRRYTRLKKGEGRMPDLLLIDGGKGQVAAVCRALEELQVTDLRVLGVAKGPGRKPGLEVLHLPDRKAALVLPPDSPALHLIQQIRDEAHRFAITGHRQRRARQRNVSPLESIPGVGAKRRQQLLQQFGGLREVTRAGVEDLSRVKGINRTLAQQIYDALHGDV